MLVHQINIMKALALFALFLVYTPVSLAQTHSLKIVINNVKDDRGTILVALYQSSADFMKKRFMSLKLQPVKGKVMGSFENVPSGVYAISVLQDLNNDMELNKNRIGIPQEGVGFSNDIFGRFGPPDFEKVAFEFPKKSELLINLKYLVEPSP